MAMNLDAIMRKITYFLPDFVKEDAIILLGVKDELQKLRQQMMFIQSFLKDAEKRKFDDLAIELWLSELKDVMYDVEDIIDLCRIEGAQLLADQNPRSKKPRVSWNFSSVFSWFTSVPLSHEIGNRIKEINDRLNRICENRERFKLVKSPISETPKFTRVDFRQTSPLVDPLVVGREVEDAASKLVDRLIGEKVDEKCRLFVVIGMGGVGKTTLAQKIFNHPKIKAFFNLDPVWVCVSQTYSETELLKEVIRGAKGSYGDARSKAELQLILRDSVALGQRLFLVLDDVWRADVWFDLLRVPFCGSNLNVRVLVTTRYENVATEMGAAYVHSVALLSEESSWEMLRKRLFSEGEVELANELKELGLEIVRRCGCLPLTIKAISGVLAGQQRTRKAWGNFLKNDAWSISKLPEGLSAALYLSFEDLPSHLKQCFLYFSLYPEDILLFCSDFVRLWVAEGFVNEQENILMEDSAEECFNELLKRNLLLPDGEYFSKMHDLVRSLAIFLSKEESYFGDLNVRNSTTSVKLRRLSVIRQKAAVQILDSVPDQGAALRTLLASQSDLLLDDERLRRLSHLRVLDISETRIEILPDSIGNLVHLRYLDLSFTDIRAIPESIGQLTNLQFLNISGCRNLRQLPSGITQLHNLRALNLSGTRFSYIPQGIEKLQQLNYLGGFVVANNESSSKLEELNSLKQLRTLHIDKLKGAQSGTIILKELPYLFTLRLGFFMDSPIPSEQQRLAVGQQQLAVEQQQLAVEELFDAMIPPKSLEEFFINGFFGRRFPNWMALSSFENYVPYLTKLRFFWISSCTELPPLGQLPQLRELTIRNATKVRKIGPEFLGGGVNSIAFPKLEMLSICQMDELEEWCFGAQVEENASPPRLKLLPCLQELQIMNCPLLKQLPKGLKYSAMKSLHIIFCQNLKSVNDLPTEIEELSIDYCDNLEKVNCPPTLKKLDIYQCKSLSFVDKFNSLQELQFTDNDMESFPEWLLNLLQEQQLQNNTDDNFKLQLKCHQNIFRGCLKGGIYWGLIQHIPLVIANCYGSSDYLRYCKQPYVYDTNVS